MYTCTYFFLILFLWTNLHVVQLGHRENSGNFITLGAAHPLPQCSNIPSAWADTSARSSFPLKKRRKCEKKKISNFGDWRLEEGEEGRWVIFLSIRVGKKGGNSRKLSSFPSYGILKNPNWAREKERKNTMCAESERKRWSSARKKTQKSFFLFSLLVASSSSSSSYP